MTNRLPKDARSKSVAVNIIAARLSVPAILNSAFMARCRHLFRIGFLSHLDRGQGRSSHMTNGDLRHLEAASRFMVCGISPAVLVANFDPKQPDYLFLPNEFGEGGALVTLLPESVACHYRIKPEPEISAADREAIELAGEELCGASA